MTTTTLETNRITPAVDLAEAEHEAAALRRTGGGISISGDKVAENTAHLPEEQRVLVRWLYGHSRDQSWSWEEAAEHCGISESTLYKIFSGKYTDAAGNPVALTGVCETIARIRRLVIDREGLERSPFVETSIYKQIAKIADETRLFQHINFIYGDSQIGKTTSLEEYTHRHNSGQTSYVRIPSCAGAILLARMMADACHLSRKLSYDETIRRLIKCLDHSKLLLFDEAHLIFETYNDKSILRCLEMIREIHDRTGAGMVFVATNHFRREMEHGKFSEMLKQLRRRGMYALQLPGVAPKADLLAIAASHKLQAPTGEAADLVKLIAHKHGLGMYCDYLTKAGHYAKKQNQRLKWEHVLKVHELIVKMGTFPAEEAL